MQYSIMLIKVVRRKIVYSKVIKMIIKLIQRTMKNANNAIHSVVTVDNDTSSGNSSADKETQEADKQNELGSGVVYKKWTTLFMF